MNSKKTLVVAVAMAIAMLVVALVAPLRAASDPGLEMEQKYGVISDPAIVGPVNLVGGKIARVAGLKGWSVKVIPTYIVTKDNQGGEQRVEDLNAYALPDGRMYVSNSLVKALAMNDDGLASILGHETAHVMLKHSRHQTKGNIIGFIVGMAAAKLLGVKSDTATSNYAGAVGGLFAAKYSRSDEYEADRVGLEYAFKAGYDPNKATSAMKLLLDRYGRGSAGIPVLGLVASHPDTKNRLMALEKQAKTLQPTTSLVNSTGFGVNAMAGGTTSPTINPRQKGTIPNIRVVVTQSTVEGDGYPNDLPSRAKSNVENGLWQAGIPIYGRGQSLDDTRREKNLEDADPRTRVEKKGVHMATANVELKTIVEKTNTRLGFTYRLTNYGDIQIGDQVEIKIRTESKFVNTETTEIALMSTAGARRKRIESVTVYVQQWGNGLYLDIRGQVEQMIREAVDEASQKMVEQIVRQVDRIPSQDGPGLTPVVRTAPTTSATPVVTEDPRTIHLFSQNKYIARIRQDGKSVVSIWLEAKDYTDIIWQSARAGELSTDRIGPIRVGEVAKFLFHQMGFPVNLDGKEYK